MDLRIGNGDDPAKNGVAMSAIEFAVFRRNRLPGSRLHFGTTFCQNGPILTRFDPFMTR
jgi:hypothetical protein